MQKVKFSDRVPAKVWMIAFIIVLVVALAALMYFVPAVADFFIGGAIYVIGVIWSGLIWCISDIRFIVGIAIPTIIFALYATRNYWHKKEGYLLNQNPVAPAASGLMSDVPGNDLLNKNIEKAD